MKENKKMHANEVKGREEHPFLRLCERVMEREINRRDFLKTGAILGGSALLVSHLPYFYRSLSPAYADSPSTSSFLYDLQLPQNQIYTTCLACHANCSVKAKVLEGVVVKLDGSPYSPMNILKPLTYSAKPQQVARFDAPLCPKGQAAIQSLYDPYRIRKVLKRAGPRGSGKFITIPFEQAIREIVEGGYLFKDIGENRYIAGFREVLALRDPKVAKTLADDVKLIQQGKMTVQEFQQKHRENLSYLIDPNHPDFGPKNNQFVFMAGRIEHGRIEFSKRFVNGSAGSINWFEHTTICEQSHHIAYDRVSAAWEDGKFGKGKTHMKPDVQEAEFIIWFGTGAYEANFGVNPLSRRTSEGYASGRLKMVVVDPRMSKTASKAIKWIPIRPGTDAAFALGMIRWIFENQRYDENFLKNANSAAASQNGESSFTDATFLVRWEDNRPIKYVRASEIGLGQPQERLGKDGKPYLFDPFVVMRMGSPTPVDPLDKTHPVTGELFVDTTLQGIRIKSVLQVVKEEAFQHTIEEWAEICGISADDIRSVAKEFTSHGKKAVVEFYRGPVQHTNGFLTALVLIYLNLLIGNIDWAGGLSAGGGHWHEIGDKSGQPFPVDSLHPGKLIPFGIPLTREGVFYEKSSLFSGYPARRIWFPFSKNVYQEVIPSAYENYPYPIKILWNHMGTPAYSTPAGTEFIRMLQDTEKFPLIISTDIVVGDTTLYADYIFPDTHYLEEWGTLHLTPLITLKCSPIRQPVAYPVPEIVQVNGEEMPCSMEAVMIAIAHMLGLSGFGEGGFSPEFPLKRPEDYYLKLMANLAYGDGPGEELPDADEEEMELFVRARKHLPPAVFHPEKWQKAVGEKLWRKVVFLLNRGGRFEDASKAYSGEKLEHKFGKLLRFFIEEVSSAKNSITGHPFPPIGTYQPISHSDGSPVSYPDYPFLLISYKDVFSTQSRTVNNYWTQLNFKPENFVEIHTSDAVHLGLHDGDMVRVISPVNEKGQVDLHNGQIMDLLVRVKVSEGIRPGVVAISHHYGHWAYGASDILIDGKLIKGDPRRKTGISPNPLMLRDKKIPHTCLADPIGGSASFYDTPVKLLKG
ncbi:MAG: molybdopterin-dependent oxidoreductase [bacterium JZ-2024 1]